MYSIILSREAEKTYRKLATTNKALFNRIDAALLSLTKDPFKGKPLKDRLKGKCSLRVGVYRIIYSIQKNKLIVWILDVAHRREAYR